MQNKGGKITRIELGSAADKADIKQGELLTHINGKPVRDVLDVGFFAQNSLLELIVKNEELQTTRKISIYKEDDEPLGLEFSDDTFDGIRSCQNRCVFCFVEQMPGGMRPSLYVKDDDYRHSFWHGNFITLTNLSEEDFDRLLLFKLSPIYVSVHATNPLVREKMLGNRKAGEVLERLRRLTDARIQVHTQIVCCPGLNDGEVLEETLKDLWSLGPCMASCAVVPVGLTAHRQGLMELKTFTKSDAQTVLKIIGHWQKKAREQRSETIFYASDEFYLLANRPFPAKINYDDFPQIENGVGLCSLFADQWKKSVKKTLVKARDLPEPKSTEPFKNRLILITGYSGAKFLHRLFDWTKEKIRLDLSASGVVILPVVNRLFGPTVTVTGLLGLKDIADQLKELEPALSCKDAVVIPEIIFRQPDYLSLDNHRLEAWKESINGPVIKVLPVDGAVLWNEIRDFLSITVFDE